MKLVSILSALVMALCVFGCETEDAFDDLLDDMVGDLETCLTSDSDGSPVKCQIAPSSLGCDTYITDQTAEIVDSCPADSTGECTDMPMNMEIYYYTTGDLEAAESNCSMGEGTWQ